jgi:hypothetical protein
MVAEDTKAKRGKAIGITSFILKQFFSMKNLLFLLPILAALWFAACDRDYNGPTVVQGRVTEFGTNAPVEGATVYFSSAASSGTWGSPNYLEFDSTLTDADGRYKATLTGDDNLNLIDLVVYKEGYDVRKNIGALPRKINDVDVTLDPFGWLRIYFKNTQHIYSTLRVSSELCTTVNDYYGWEVDTNFLCNGIANRYMQLNFLKPKPNGSGTWDYILKDTVYVPGHDTTNYYFTY